MRKTGRYHNKRKAQMVEAMKRLNKPADVFEINRERGGCLFNTRNYLLDLEDQGRVRMVGKGLDAYQQKYELTEEEQQDAAMAQVQT